MLPCLTLRDLGKGLVAVIGTLNVKLAERYLGTE